MSDPIHLRPTPALAFMKEVHIAGRNAGPVMLHEAWSSGRLARDDLRRVVTSVWQGAEWPTAHLGVAAWVALFRECGFVSDDSRSAPVEPLEAYRGTSWGRRRGMSWTTNLEVARWFAGRYGRDAHVFRAEVPPGAVLALIGMEGGRNEHEVVVDPSLLPRPRPNSSVFTPP